MLFHSLRTKVLRSLHNNIQQPVIYLVEGKSVIAPVVLIWEKTDKGGLSLITRTTPTKQHTFLQFSVAKKVDWNCLSSAESFINARSRLQLDKPSEDLPLVGREESEVWFTSCKQFVNTPLSFYSTFGAELPTTSECFVVATNSPYFGEMPPSMHTIDGVET